MLRIPELNFPNHLLPTSSGGVIPTVNRQKRGKKIPNCRVILILSSQLLTNCKIPPGHILQFREHFKKRWLNKQTGAWPVGFRAQNSQRSVDNVQPRWPFVWMNFGFEVILTGLVDNQPEKNTFSNQEGI